MDLKNIAYWTPLPSKQNLGCHPPGSYIKVSPYKPIEFIPIPHKYKEPNMTITDDEPSQQHVHYQAAACLNSIRNEKREIARMAYKEVKAAIEKWEEDSGQEIYCHWDECIVVVSVSDG